MGMTEAVKFVQVTPESVRCQQNMHTVWRVIGKESGIEYGFVASHVYSRMKRDGNIQETMTWGCAVKAEEFVTGINFPHRQRRVAAIDLHRKWEFSVPSDLEEGLAKIEKLIY